MSAGPPVEFLDVRVPAGGRVLVVGGLRLGQDETAASRLAVAELVRAVDEWTGPGLVVLAGDIFDLLGMADPSVDRILAGHARLRSALAAFAADDEHSLVVLPGARDHRLAWDQHSAAAVGSALGAELATAVRLTMETGEGERVVHVESGHGLDPLWAYVEPATEADAPLGVHLVTDVLPQIEGADRPWLADAGRIEDPAALVAMVASRDTYRRATRQLRWLLLAVALAAAVRIPAISSRAGPWAVGLPLLGIVTDLAILTVVLLIGTRRIASAARDMALVRETDRGNEVPRARARELVAGGVAGLVTSHTGRAELSTIGEGFYANPGACDEVVVARPARLGLPPVFVLERQLGFVELEAGADLHVRLDHGTTVVAAPTLIERLVARPGERAEGRPSVVASFPNGPVWPPPAAPGADVRRARRWAAAFIGLAGIVDIVSALTPPSAVRLRAVLDFMPLEAALAAHALVALAGVGLLLLAGGIRRGQRHAWQLALGLLVATAALNIVKGGDLEEAAVALAAAAYLLRRRGAFRGRAQPSSIVRGALTAALGAAVATVTATAAVEVFHRGRPRPPLGRAFLAVVERLVGITTVPIGGRTGRFLTPSLGAVGFGLVVAAGWLVFRPALAHRPQPRSDLERARGVVRRHGGDTIAYFALRHDKQFFFWGDSVVAYAVFGAVALVSPDPIGPPAERDEVWSAFRHFADAHAWHIAVLGAGEAWLGVYRSAGLHDLYVGDEAIVDCRRFSLEGGRAKGLRQAVNRVARNGYTVTFHDPATIEPALRRQLEDLMGESRRGAMERGFSMTLGRIFEPDDRGLLLAVATDADGVPAAFCQYVPAPDIDGWSLDLMRRTAREDVPNGLTDFVVVETIEHVRARGQRGLALNFATMRAVLAGEEGSGITGRVERWLLQRMSGSMQIESLWYFNAKYDPEWRPRYAVYDSVEYLASAMVAVARAESFWELPLIGRFLRPAAQA